MRISDLSSDVCSSDLAEAQIDLDHQTRADIAAAFQLAAGDVLADRTINAMHMAEGLIGVATRRLVVAGGVDRKSVVEGKSVSVSVDLGGRRIINKKKHLCITRIDEMTREMVND